MEQKSTVRRRRDPIESRQKILLAATKEFVKYGFDAARIDHIASGAKVNKQLIYYYFKSKDLLFTEVLKDAYRGLRAAEEACDYSPLNGKDAILKRVEITWNHYLAHPDLIFLLASENLMKGRHIKAFLKDFQDINRSWHENMRILVDKGIKDKSLKFSIDAMQLNISLSGLIIFSITNTTTLSLLYGVDLSDTTQRNLRLSSILETVDAWLSRGLPAQS